MPSLIPKSGYAIVEPIHEPDGAIIIPDIARGDLQSQYRVVAMGKGKVIKRKNGKFLRLNPEFKAGDVIVANRYTGREVVPVNGRYCKVIEHSSVIAVVEETILPTPYLPLSPK